jgi:hypothetical protein
MARRGRCQCGMILKFHRGPDGYKTRCPTCGSVVRLRTGGRRPRTEGRMQVCVCGAAVALPAYGPVICPRCNRDLTSSPALPALSDWPPSPTVDDATPAPQAFETKSSVPALPVAPQPEEPVQPDVQPSLAPAADSAQVQVETCSVCGEVVVGGIGLCPACASARARSTAQGQTATPVPEFDLAAITFPENRPTSFRLGLVVVGLAAAAILGVVAGVTLALLRLR